MGEGGMEFTEHESERYARLALNCIHREHPHYFDYILAIACPGTVVHPRELTPAFYGCFDWHSAVHSHWSLVRMMKRFPNAFWIPEARKAIAQNITHQNIAQEVKYFNQPQLGAFERPYGLAWMLQLVAELKNWNDDQGQEWAGILLPMEELASERLMHWLEDLPAPIRTGEHGQTAFAMGLALDWARDTGQQHLWDRFATVARRFHGGDLNAEPRQEPSAYDFLSPILAEADLMRRLLSSDEYAVWLQQFLPCLEAFDPATWLLPVPCTDPSDGKLSHLIGLSLSRAWMLEGIASALPASDIRKHGLRSTAMFHRESGLAGIDPAHYSGSHWLGSFAVYLLTERGIVPG